MPSLQIVSFLRKKTSPNLKSIMLIMLTVQSQLFFLTIAEDYNSYYMILQLILTNQIINGTNLYKFL